MSNAGLLYSEFSKIVCNVISKQKVLLRIIQLVAYNITNSTNKDSASSTIVRCLSQVLLKKVMEPASSLFFINN